MLLEPKNGSSIDSNASSSFTFAFAFYEEIIVISELRADLANAVAEPRSEKIHFFLRIPKFRRKVIDEAHVASIGEANLPSASASWCVHLDTDTVGE